MLTREELDEVVLTLENEGKFYVWCLDNLTSCTETHWFNTLKYFYRGHLTPRLCGNQIAYLKKYFWWRFKTTQIEDERPCYKGPWKRTPQEQPTSRHYRGANHDWKAVSGSDDQVSGDSILEIKTKLILEEMDRLTTWAANNFSSPPSQPEFNPMTPLKFKTLFTLNGVDVSTFTDEQIYTAIKAEEDRIAQLKLIKNQPKKLQAEITAAEAQLTKLIEHLDSK